MTDLPAWHSSPLIVQLFAAAKNAGGELRAVGGAVRDWRMGVASSDVDFATTLLPDQVMELAKAQGWKAVPTGIDHGTVTLVLDGKGHEITTLRRDVKTDGRHAEVAYTDDWQEDAARRDFTVNAIYMDAAGTVYDPTGQGEADLQARHLRFIGDAGQRIAEDGLRILRYFRFLATLCWPGDAPAIAACEAQRAMLANLSGERIAQEMRKLLRSDDPRAALRAMNVIGLPEYLTASPWDVAALDDLLAYEWEHRVAGDGWVRLLAMIAPEVRSETAHWLGERWKLSRVERLTLATLAHAETAVNPARVKTWLRAESRPIVIGKILLASLDSDEALAVAELLQLAQDWQVPVFPVTAKDLLAQGMQEGPALGAALKAIEQRWVESDYQLTRDMLLTPSR